MRIDEKRDYVMVVHPWTLLRLKWMQSLKEGPYSFVWKAEKDQTYADYRGWGINEQI